MKRRIFLQNSLKAFAGLSLPPMTSVFQPNNKNAKYAWKLFVCTPKHFPLWGDSLSTFVKEVYQESDGQLAITTYNILESSSYMNQPGRAWSELFANSFQVGHFSPVALSYLEPATTLFGHTPFGLEAQDLDSYLKSAPGVSQSSQVFSKINIKHIPFGVISKPGLWSKKEITGVSDFVNDRVRCMGPAKEALDELGAQPKFDQFCDFREKYISGEIDHLEGISTSIDMKFKLHEHSSFYYVDQWPKRANAMGLHFNMKAWGALSKKLQDIVTFAGRRAHDSLTIKTKEQDQKALSELNGKVQVKVLPENVRTKMMSVARELESKNMSNSAIFQSVKSQMNSGIHV